VIESSLVNRIQIELLNIKTIVERINMYSQLFDDKSDKVSQDVLSDGLALNLHSFYTAVERIFEFIAKTIDGDLPTGDKWHKILLEQMLVDVPQVRPAVITDRTLKELDEFRRFRHVIRSVYAYELKSEKLLILADKVPRLYSELRIEIEDFMEKSN